MPFVGLLGIVAIIACAWTCSLNRKAIRWSTLGWGLLLQFAFAIGILGIPRLHWPGVFRFVFDFLNNLVGRLIGFSDAGSDFVFGKLGHPDQPFGFIFAFRALPTIIFFSAVTAVLYHLGILQKVVKGIAWVMQKTLKSSGAESLSAAANIFIGQTEAPLLVRPFIPGMTKSEIFCVMVGGMATIAAGVMGAYVGLLKARIPDIAGHLLTASAMAAPAAIMISKILVPEHERPATAGRVTLNDERPDSNFVEAAARGAAEGLQLALNVAAMLIAFIALMAALDWMLGAVGDRTGFAHWGVFLYGGEAPPAGAHLSLSLILGWAFSPVAWLIGVPWSEAGLIGRVLGEKIILNEFVAYVHLSEVANKLSDRTVIVTSYALCGFANFSSIGIQLGGLGTLAPNQRPRLAQLGFLAVLGGSLSTFLTASIAGLLF